MRIRGKTGYQHSQQTKDKIGAANKGVWIKHNCDNCGIEREEKQSHYNSKKRHFCSIKCYGLYRANKMPIAEQPSYRGVRVEGESKQVYHRRYCKKNPETIKRLKKKRRDLETGATGSHTEAEWDALKESYGNVCACCKEPKKLQRDHIIPLSKGGVSYIENIQPLCGSCNAKKYQKIIVFLNTENLKY